MRHFLLLGILGIIIAFTALVVNVYKPSKSAFSISIERNVTASVTIGEPLFVLYGYTSPKSIVQLTGNAGVSAQTESEENGYFRFTNVYLLPITTELCLTSIDQSSRTTSPTCISAPSFPLKGKEIGPIILSPTISLGKGQFLPEETVEANGRSIPNTEVDVSLFRAEPTLFERLFPIAFADTLPLYTIKTDKNGYFSFNLPSATSNTFRLFTQAKFNSSPSPKSNTLTFRVLTIFEYFLERIRLFLLFLLNLIRGLPLLETLILLELILLILLLFPRKKKFLQVMDKDIVLYNKGRELDLPQNKLTPS